MHADLMAELQSKFQDDAELLVAAVSVYVGVQQCLVLILAM